jgi:regulator of cell morphogenesis and NO signaling
MNITEARTVGEIAVEYTGSIPLFENWKIDFCCGGKKSLKEACEQKGLPLQEVLGTLQRKAAERMDSGEMNWKEKSVGEIIRFIEDKHHIYTRSQTGLLRKLAEKVARGHGENHSELAGLNRLVQQMSDELDDHLAKEEQVLFTFFRKAEAGGAEGMGPVLTMPIKVMMMEHETVGKQLLEARGLTHNFTPPEDACNSFQALYRGLADLEADLHRHIHLENNVLFPKAAEMGLAG